MRLYLGVDPGKSGGMGIIDGRGKAMNHFKFGSATERDIFEFITRNYPAGETEIAFAWLEQVNAMPNPMTGKGMGVSSAFKFGDAYGFIRGILVASQIPFDRKTPRTWQKVLGIPKRGKNESTTQFKNRTKQKAQELFPTEKMTHAIADAYLIAEACRRSRTERVRL